MVAQMTAATGGFPNIYADLSQATAATINQLRQAFQVQKLYERDARGGTRYTEMIKSHFGVTSPDARLQRPEYLGGGQSMVNIHQVEQQSRFGVWPNATGQLGRIRNSSAVRSCVQSVLHGTWCDRGTAICPC